MKITNLIMASILFATSGLASAEILPEPQTVGGQPLMKVMNERKSSRDIDPNSTISKQDLSNILWAAWGITHDGKRTIGTAMNRQELEIYVITATEISKYSAEDNSLTIVNKGDFRDISAMQDFAKVAPVNIVLVGDNTKQQRAEFQHYAAGAASQNIYLYCAQADLKTVVRAGCDREKLAQAMKLDNDHTILYVQTVGK